ncbi:hypothetical protein [Streptomyces sp. MNP-20]|uniref:hypothetical protein n=1 Tax=Streptomyces sp. MNP-20 TaxID=2721165 RepID=UPI0020A62632|nr:hypothetical protein [Streptomyces sp. MNP-20]
MPKVTEAVSDEIALLRVGDLAPGLAQLALSLARSVDEPGGPTAKANAARELRAVMADLRKLAPVAGQDDRLDELTKKREARRARPA